MSGGSFNSDNQFKRWSLVYFNKYYVLNKNQGKGTWVIFYFSKLLILSLPFFNKQINIAAKATLINLIKERLIR
jgi:hypothetical protein